MPFNDQTEQIKFDLQRWKSESSNLVEVYDQDNKIEKTGNAYTDAINDASALICTFDKVQVALNRLKDKVYTDQLQGIESSICIMADESHLMTESRGFRGPAITALYKSFKDKDISKVLSISATPDLLKATHEEATIINVKRDKNPNLKYNFLRFEK